MTDWKRLFPPDTPLAVASAIRNGVSGACLGGTAFGMSVGELARLIFTKYNLGYLPKLYNPRTVIRG